MGDASPWMAASSGSALGAWPAAESQTLTWVVRRLGRGCPSGGEQGGGVYEESPASLSPSFPWPEGVGSQDPETRCVCGLHSSVWVCRGSTPATSHLDKILWEGWLRGGGLISPGNRFFPQPPAPHPYLSLWKGASPQGDLWRRGLKAGWTGSGVPVLIPPPPLRVLRAFPTSSHLILAWTLCRRLATAFSYSRGSQRLREGKGPAQGHRAK